VPAVEYAYNPYMYSYLYSPTPAALEASKVKATPKLASSYQLPYQPSWGPSPSPYRFDPAYSYAYGGPYYMSPLTRSDLR
jgi:hypothetical protein